MATGGDDDILLSGFAGLIGHRGRTARGRKLKLPELFAGSCVESAEGRIDHRSSDENQATGRGDRSAEAGRAKGNFRLGGRDRTEGNLPANGAGGHIHGSESAPRRRRTRKMVGLGKEKCAEHAVGRASLLRVVEPSGVFVDGVPILVGRDYAHFRGQSIGVDEEQAALRVEGVTAPIHAANIARHGEGALQTWRSEEAVIAQTLDSLAANFAIFLGNPPSIFGGKFLWRDRRWGQGKRLRGRGHFSGHIGLRDGLLFHGENWNARIAIQDK